MKKLSLTMIVKNEARCLERCLQSVQNFVDELIVVDTGSTDQTVQIAIAHHACVYHFPWIDDFSAARNFSLQQSHGDWILVLDADEWVSPRLADEIRQFINGPPQIGCLKIINSFQRHGQTLQTQSYVSRLFPRGTYFQNQIHEQVVSPLPRCNLQGELWHDGYMATDKTARNIPLLLRETEQHPTAAYWFYHLARQYTISERTTEALTALEKAYSLLQSEDACGPEVVVDYLYSLMDAEKFERGLEVIEKNKQWLNDYPDFHFVCGLFFMNLVRRNPAQYISYLPRIEESYQCCLALGETSKYQSARGTGSFLASYNLGIMYEALGQTAVAQKFFQQSAALDYEPAIQMLRREK